MGSKEAEKWTTTAAAAYKNSKVWHGSDRSTVTINFAVFVWIVFFLLVHRWSEKSSAQRSSEIISYLRFVKRVDLYMGFCVFFFFFWAIPLLVTAVFAANNCNSIHCCSNWKKTQGKEEISKVLFNSSFISSINTIRLFFHRILFLSLFGFLLMFFKCVYC